MDGNELAKSTLMQVPSVPECFGGFIRGMVTCDKCPHNTQCRRNYINKGRE